METIYESLINELKSKLYFKKISFKKIMKLINNQEQDKFINYEIIYYENIETLINNIKTEKEKTVYESLINELKSTLNLKNISFKKIMKLINNQEYDEIIKIINYEIIYYEILKTLINEIETEREKIGNNLEKKINNLIWLNETLIHFNKEPQPTKTKALKLLKTISINIYDIEAGFYEKRKSFKKLKEQLNNYPETRYPLRYAKNNETLKCFLKNLTKHKPKKIKNNN
jgi:predicted site-specific integrase-resolvase